MGKYFGTDGFRGEANRTLTVQHAFEIGRFIGWYFGKEHKCKVVIGKDTRRSCYMFEDALSAGLTASGADVLPAARHDHAQRILRRADGGLRLRDHDHGQPQPLYRQRHQARQQQGRKNGAGRAGQDRGAPGRAAAPPSPWRPARRSGGRSTISPAATVMSATSFRSRSTPTRTSASASTAPTAAPGRLPKACSTRSARKPMSSTTSRTA